MKKNEKQFDMLDFLDKNITKYDSMYKILASYLPNLDGDFSTANLVNSIKSSEICQKKNGNKDYENYFNILSSILILAFDKNNTLPGKKENIDRELTDQERNDLLIELKNTIPDSKFNSIEEYVDFAKQNIDNPKTEELRKLIVNNAVKFGNKDKMNAMRCKMLSLFYLSQVTNHLKQKYSGYERIDGQYPEWNLIEFIDKTLTNPVTLKQYDDCLDEYDRRIEKNKKRERVSNDM